MPEGEGPFDPYATGKIPVEACRAGKTAAGRFTLNRILGKGGMGVVWLAHDERLDTDVALKFLPSQIQSDVAALDELRRETARSHKLSHPNIVRIHDLYELKDEDPFISMEFVDGLNLAAFRVGQANRVISWEVLGPLVQQLCSALEFAHGEGIIHRDIKPSNLMVDTAARLKLADFGIACALTETLNRLSNGQTSGTLVYMSLQQLEGKSPKPTDDIYAVGATLYELLTSKPPFFSGDLLHQVRNIEASPMSERLLDLGMSNSVPSHVEKTILACLSKAESQRPQTARELGEWLATERKAILVSNGAAITARNPLAVLATRQKRFILALGAVLLLLLMVTAGLWRGKRGEDVHVSARRSDIPHENSKAKAIIPVDKASPATQEPKDSRPVVLTNSSAPWSPSALVTDSVKTIPTLASAPSTSPATQPTALELARKGYGFITLRSKDKLLHIHADRAPIDTISRRWQITYADPLARYKIVEVRFEGDQMVRSYEPGGLFEVFSTANPKPMAIESLKTDSDEALTILLELPVVKEIAIRNVEFDLERGYGDLPVWKIRVFGPSSGGAATGNSLGYIIISADDGKILKETLSKNQSRNR